LIKTYLHCLIPEESLNLRMGEGRPVAMEKSTEETKVEVVIIQELYLSQHPPTSSVTISIHSFWTFSA
jgi:hypothetical protein